MIVRVRGRAGTWRIKDLSGSSTVRDLKRRVFEEHKVPIEDQVIRVPGGVGAGAGAGAGAGGAGAAGVGEPLDDHATLASAGVKHGDLLQLDYAADIEVTAETGTRTVMADGSIVAVGGKRGAAGGFRPGLMALRDMKMHWTLTEMTELSSQYEFKVQRQKAEEAACKGVSLDGGMANGFQQYLHHFSFSRPRFGILYGHVGAADGEDAGKVYAEAVYEVPQTFTEEEGQLLLEDPREEEVDALAGMLGMQRVGIIFSHAPREKGFNFTGDEVLTAAVHQMAAGEKSPFVTVKVTCDEEGKANFEAFQVSDQCVTMVGRDALDVNPADPRTVAVSKKFSAIVEAKEVDAVDNDFFLVPVPVLQHTSSLFASASFPSINRDTAPVTIEDVAEHLRAHKGQPMHRQLADWQLLLYLSSLGLFDLRTDMPVIADAVVHGTEVPEGYALLINSNAGLA